MGPYTNVHIWVCEYCFKTNLEKYEHVLECLTCMFWHSIWIIFFSHPAVEFPRLWRCQNLWPQTDLSVSGVASAPPTWTWNLWRHRTPWPWSRWTTHITDSQIGSLLAVTEASPQMTKGFFFLSSQDGSKLCASPTKKSGWVSTCPPHCPQVNSDLLMWVSAGGFRWDSIVWSFKCSISCPLSASAAVWRLVLPGLHERAGERRWDRRAGKWAGGCCKGN